MSQSWDQTPSPEANKERAESAPHPDSHCPSSPIYGRRVRGMGWVLVFDLVRTWDSQRECIPVPQKCLQERENAISFPSCTKEWLLHISGIEVLVYVLSN